MIRVAGTLLFPRVGLFAAGERILDIGGGRLLVSCAPPNGRVEGDPCLGGPLGFCPVLPLGVEEDNTPLPPLALFTGDPRIAPRGLDC